MSKIPLSDFEALYELLRGDPQAFLDMTNERIRADGTDPSNYFDRHFAWLHLCRPDLAMDDLDHSLELMPRQLTFLARGRLCASLGHHHEALDDFARGEALAPERWRENGDPLHQAISFAALGQKEAALAACARLPEDVWSPGEHGMPRGDKEDITGEIRRRAFMVAIRPPGPEFRD